MKNKKKKEISDNSDSDDDAFHNSRQNINNNVKYNADRSLKSKTLEQKPFVCDVTPSNNSIVPESENESSSDEIPHSQDAVEEQTHSTFNVDELTSDDEIYMLQCPENYTKQDLCNKNIDFTKHKQSITLNGEVCKVEFLNSEKKFITLAVPKNGCSGSLLKIPFKGHIIIKKNIKLASGQLEDVKVSDSLPVVFPKDIKVRHPLLGAEWKSYIELANKAISRSITTKKKSKKRKEGKHHENDETEKLKIKRENSQTDIVVHKKKRKKHD